MQITNRVDENIKRIEELFPNCLTEVKYLAEKGLREILLEVIDLYKSVKPSNHHVTEKVWDALERLKTIYVTIETDKKRSIGIVLDKLSKGNTDFRVLFETEFKELIGFGDRFRIRHHETDKIDIADDKYFDYFFNRCFVID